LLFIAVLAGALSPSSADIASTRALLVTGLRGVTRLQWARASGRSQPQCKRDARTRGESV